jgi:nitronate monooxygenase
LAANALGAAGVQSGTAYLRCRESRVTALHRARLLEARDDTTEITNVFTGRPARSLLNRFSRELGPLNPSAPDFPLAAGALAPLRAAAEAHGSSDFSPLWAGQAAPLAGAEDACEYTRTLWQETLARLSSLHR